MTDDKRRKDKGQRMAPASQCPFYWDTAIIRYNTTVVTSDVSNSTKTDVIIRCRKIARMPTNSKMSIDIQNHIFNLVSSFLNIGSISCFSICFFVLHHHRLARKRKIIFLTTIPFASLLACCFSDTAYCVNIPSFAIAPRSTE